MYRWLLLFYPREYRRDRAAEILEIVHDVQPARRAGRVAANLVRHGMRARLGRPASRTVAVWASVVAVACGLFAASFGIWLAWLDSHPLHAQEIAAAAGQLYPDQPTLHVSPADPPAVFLIYGGPLGLSNLSDLLLGDGAEYDLATVGASLPQLPAGNQADTLAQLLQRLHAAGWEVAEPVYSQVYDCIPHDPRCDPTSIPSNITVDARRGDSLLEVEIRTPQSSPIMGFSMSRTTPWTAYAAGVAGFLLGAAGGWFLFGWASRRLERGYRAAQVLAKIIFGFVVFLWWTPILLIAPLLLVDYLRHPALRWAPLWVWLGEPTLLLPFLASWVFGYLALSMAVVPRPKPADLGYCAQP